MCKNIPTCSFIYYHIYLYYKTLLIGCLCILAVGTLISITSRAKMDPNLGIYTHIISLTNIRYGTFTSKVIRGHQRSLEVKKRSKLKCSPRDFIFGMHYHMISLTNISYDILTLKGIRGHQRSLEVKMRSKLKCSPRDIIFGMHSQMISLTNISYDI